MAYIRVFWWKSHQDCCSPLKSTLMTLMTFLIILMVILIPKNYYNQLLWSHGFQKCIIHWFYFRKKLSRTSISLKRLGGHSWHSWSSWGWFQYPKPLLTDCPDCKDSKNMAYIRVFWWKSHQDCCSPLKSTLMTLMTFLIILMVILIPKNYYNQLLWSHGFQKCIIHWFYFRKKLSRTSISLKRLGGHSWHSWSSWGWFQYPKPLPTDCPDCKDSKNMAYIRYFWWKSHQDCFSPLRSTWRTFMTFLIILMVILIPKNYFNQLLWPQGLQKGII